MMILCRCVETDVHVHLKVSVVRISSFIYCV